MIKAIRVAQFGGPEALRVEQIPQLVPGAKQVLVRVKAAGLNPVETYIRSGTHTLKPALPYTPGNDSAGVVEAVGADVASGVQPGDRVYTSGSATGTYAEQTLADESCVHPLPDNVSFAEGACVNTPYATAYRALFQRGGARPGETLFVHGGSGAVGLACVQFARAHGLSAIASASTEAGRALIAAHGAIALSHASAAYLDELAALTSGRGVDLIAEMASDLNLDNDLTALSKYGRVVIVGNRGPVEINPRTAMTKELDIRGVMLPAASPQDKAQAHRAIHAGLATGALRPPVTATFALEEAPAAHEALLAPGAAGNKVLVVSDD